MYLISDLTLVISLYAPWQIQREKLLLLSPKMSTWLCSLDHERRTRYAQMESKATAIFNLFRVINHSENLLKTIDLSPTKIHKQTLTFVSKWFEQDGNIMVLGQPDIHVQKNGVGSLLTTFTKTKLQMDHRPKWKIYFFLEENIG
jgi:hypothetical protein